MIKHIDDKDSLRLKMNGGVYELNETLLFKRLLKPTDIFVDIGAHIGYYSDIAAGIITSGEIHAFEPNPENFKLLDINMLSNKPEPKISLYQLAMGNKFKSGGLYVNDKNTGDHRAYKTKGESRRKVEVEFAYLDGFDYFNKINFLKIDTQGFEVEVLKGAKRIINESPDLQMIVEYSPVHLKLAGTTPGTLIGILVDYGFNIYVHTKRGWLYANSETFLPNNDNHRNLFCSRKRYQGIEWGE